MMCINREGALLIWTHNSLTQVHMREKKFVGEKKKLLLSLGFILYCFGIALGDRIYTKEVVGFSSLWFPRRNSLCYFILLCLYFFQWSYFYGYDEIMLNVWRSNITIKIITWYQSYPKISLCAVETNKSWKIGFPNSSTSLHKLTKKWAPYNFP